MAQKSIESGWPRVDAELNMTRARVAEVAQARGVDLAKPQAAEGSLRQPPEAVRPAPLARQSVLPDAPRPTAADIAPRPLTLPDSQPTDAPAARAPLPASRPTAADAAPRRPTLPAAAPLAPPERAPTLPTHASPTVAEPHVPVVQPREALAPAPRLPLLPTFSAAQATEQGRLPRPAPAVESPRPEQHTAGTVPFRDMFAPVESYDRSRIVWRDGPATMRG